MRKKILVLLFLILLCSCQQKPAKQAKATMPDVSAFAAVPKSDEVPPVYSDYSEMDEWTLCRQVSDHWHGGHKTIYQNLPSIGVTGDLVKASDGRWYFNDGSQWNKLDIFGVGIPTFNNGKAYVDDTVRITDGPTFGPTMFQITGFEEPTLRLSFPQSTKNDQERWLSIYTEDAQWTFRIYSQEYTLTGKELADAVKLSKLVKFTPDVPLESVTGNELDTRQAWEPPERIDGSCTPVCMVTVYDKQGALVELYDSPDRYVHRPNPFVAQPNGTWHVYVDRGVHVHVVEK